MILYPKDHAEVEDVITVTEEQDWEVQYWHPNTMANYGQGNYANAAGFSERYCQTVVTYLGSP